MLKLAIDSRVESRLVICLHSGVNFRYGGARKSSIIEKRNGADGTNWTAGGRRSFGCLIITFDINVCHSAGSLSFINSLP